MVAVLADLEVDNFAVLVVVGVYVVGLRVVGADFAGLAAGARVRMFVGIGSAAVEFGGVFRVEERHSYGGLVGNVTDKAGSGDVARAINDDNWRRRR